MLRRLLPVLLAAVLVAPLPARLAGEGLEMSISPILTIDRERLFAESRLGEEIGREMEARSEALAAENRRIEAELIAEEQALTERRKTMTPEEFRPLAEAFDAKVQRIRAEQDAKERELNKAREEAQARFLGRIVPILGQLAAERGAVAILDRRTVFLAADSIDITDEAIARINAMIAAGGGDGGGGGGGGGGDDAVPGGGAGRSSDTVPGTGPDTSAGTSPEPSPEPSTSP